MKNPLNKNYLIWISGIFFKENTTGTVSRLGEDKFNKKITDFISGYKILQYSAYLINILINFPTIQLLLKEFNQYILFISAILMCFSLFLVELLIIGIIQNRNIYIKREELLISVDALLQQ